MNLVSNLFFTEIDFCKPKVIQGLDLKGLKSELCHVNVLFFLFQGYSDIRESTLL